MKKLLTAVIISILASSIYALPGVNHFLKDNPGEFVYYKDNSFTRESYIGFLTYNETTFAARYFAPATDSLPAKNIELLYTINPDKEFVELTGERFITPIVPDDTEVINYIHDLIYEFGKRRKNIGEISPAAEQDKNLNPQVQYENKSSLILDFGLKSKEVFDQFGGEVSIYYDYLVPIFNIKLIKNNAGDTVLETVAIGMLKSSADRSFSEFSVIPPAPKNPAHKQKNKKPKANEVDFGSTTITLDQNWTTAGQFENVYFYGNAAMLRTAVIDKADFYLYLKTCLLSSKANFVPWKQISISRKADDVKITANSYSGEKDFINISQFKLKNEKMSENENSVLLMVISRQDYEEFQKYYSDILKSWR